MDRKTHWNNVYQNNKLDEVSWFQQHSEISLTLFNQYEKNLNSNIIDIGAGGSMLVDDLLEIGYKNVDLLDISEKALSQTDFRLQKIHNGKHNSVNFIIGDILETELPENHYDVWHDRAVFHFLTDPDHQRLYINRCINALRPNRKVIISTFGPDGPLQCSGLPIVRYDHKSLHDNFGSVFKLIDHGNENHVTPFGNTQKFIYCYCKLEKNDNSDN